MTLLSPADYQLFPTVEPDYRYAYGSHPEQFGELTLPRSEAPHPVIVLIHGGGYRQLYDLRPLGQVVKALAAKGFAVWNIEYRRQGNGGDYPNMFLDVAAGADYLPQLAAAHALDLSNVISMGHSAGGHLALWLAGRRRIKRESPLYAEEPIMINAVLALAPLADVARAAEHGLSSDALADVMGGDPASAPANFRNGSPTALLPFHLPQTIIVGSEDAAMLVNARSYVQEASARGDAVELIVLPGAGHFEIVAVGTDAFDATWGAALRLRERMKNVRLNSPAKRLP